MNVVLCCTRCSELFLSPAQVKLVCSLKVGGDAWGRPTLDVFPGAARGQHTTSNCYTLYYAPGSVGVNGMQQHQAADVQVHGHCSLLWSLPPFALS